MTSTGLTARIWFGTWTILTAGIFFYSLLYSTGEAVFILLGTAIASCIGSLPALVVILIATGVIKNLRISLPYKMYSLALLLFLITLPYGLAAGILDSGFTYNGWDNFLKTTLMVTGILLACSFISYFISRRKIQEYFEAAGHEYSHNILQLEEKPNSINQINMNMETTY
ncbi:MAG TPA: hypothetical protein VN958_18400 [Chitinophagaceae bacterium]|nr:hypothetical protein [Chitinophagaceae bacterium]